MAAYQGIYWIHDSVSESSATTGNTYNSSIESVPISRHPIRLPIQWLRDNRTRIQCIQALNTGGAYQSLRLQSLTESNLVGRQSRRKNDIPGLQCICLWKRVSPVSSHSDHSRILWRRLRRVWIGDGKTCTKLSDRQDTDHLEYIKWSNRSKHGLHPIWFVLVGCYSILVDELSLDDRGHLYFSPVRTAGMETVTRKNARSWFIVGDITVTTYWEVDITILVDTSIICGNFQSENMRWDHAECRH